MSSLFGMPRASYQKHGNFTSKPKSQPPKGIASPLEMQKLNSAIVALSNAKKATTEAALTAQTSEAYRLCRDIVRGRLD